MNPDAVPQVGVALKSTVDIVLSFGSDFFIYVAAVAAIAVFAFYFGRDRLVPLAAGCYAAVILYLHFPYMNLLGGNIYLEAGLYIAFAVAGLVAFSGLQSWIPSSGLGFVKVLLLSAILAAFMLAVAINLFPTDLYTWSGPTKALFAPNLFFWWLAAPLAGVLLLGR
jgi:hypothetical protein